MSDGDERTTELKLVAAAISEQIAQIHTESYETPVRHAVTHIADDLVVTVFDIELSLMERRMIEFGNSSLVHELRHAVQSAEAASFNAVADDRRGLAVPRRARLRRRAGKVGGAARPRRRPRCAARRQFG